MVGVGGSVVVVFMAAKASVRGIVVIPIVAFGAVVHEGMRTIKRPIIIVNGKGRWHPVGVSRVAIIAGSR